MLKGMKWAANSRAWALGEQQSNGFHVRRVVWGLEMAHAERRAHEEIRATAIMVEQEWKRRHPSPKNARTDSSPRPSAPFVE